MYGKKELSVVGYLQALSDLISHSILIYEELKYDIQSEKDDEETKDGEEE